MMREVGWTMTNEKETEREKRKRSNVSARRLAGVPACALTTLQQEHDAGRSSM